MSLPRRRCSQQFALARRPRAAAKVVAHAAGPASAQAAQHHQQRVAADRGLAHRQHPAQDAESQPARRCRVLGVDLSAPSALDVGRRAAAQAALKAALNVTGRTGSDYRSRVWSLVAIESIIWVLNFPQKPPSLAVICAWVRLFLNQEEIYEVL